MGTWVTAAMAELTLAPAPATWSLPFGRAVSSYRDSAAVSRCPVPDVATEPRPPCAMVTAPHSIERIKRDHQAEPTRATGRTGEPSGTHRVPPRAWSSRPGPLPSRHRSEPRASTTRPTHQSPDTRRGAYRGNAHVHPRTSADLRAGQGRDAPGLTPASPMTPAPVGDPWSSPRVGTPTAPQPTSPGRAERVAWPERRARRGHAERRDGPRTHAELWHGGAHRSRAPWQEQHAPGAQLARRTRPCPSG